MNTLLTQSGHNQILFQRCCPLCSHCNYHKLQDHLGFPPHQLDVIRAFLSGNTTNVHPQRSPHCPESIKSTKLKVDGRSNIIMPFAVVQLDHSLFAGTCQPVVGSIVSLEPGFPFQILSCSFGEKSEKPGFEAIPL